MMHRASITIDKPTKAKLKVLGNGSLSVGIRLAILLLERAEKAGYLAGDLKWLRVAAENPQIAATIIGE